MSQPVSQRNEGAVRWGGSAAEAGATEVTMVSVTAASSVPNTFFAVCRFIMVSSAVGGLTAEATTIVCIGDHPRPPIGVASQCIASLCKIGWRFG